VLGADSARIPAQIVHDRQQSLGIVFGRLLIGYQVTIGRFQLFQQFRQARTWFRLYHLYYPAEDGVTVYPAIDFADAVNDQEPGLFDLAYQMKDGAVMLAYQDHIADPDLAQVIDR
jgi:hypothetical protein